METKSKSSSYDRDGPLALPIRFKYAEFSYDQWYGQSALQIRFKSLIRAILVSRRVRSISTANIVQICKNFHRPRVGSISSANWFRILHMLNARMTKSLVNHHCQHGSNMQNSREGNVPLAHTVQICKILVKPRTRSISIADTIQVVHMQILVWPRVRSISTANTGQISKTFRMTKTMVNQHCKHLNSRMAKSPVN